MLGVTSPDYLRHMSEWNDKVIAEFRAHEGRVGGRVTLEGHLSSRKVTV